MAKNKNNPRPFISVMASLGTQTAKYFHLKPSRRMVKKWARLFNKTGLCGLKENLVLAVFVHYLLRYVVFAVKKNQKKGTCTKQ